VLTEQQACLRKELRKNKNLEILIMLVCLAKKVLDKFVLIADRKNMDKKNMI